MIKMTDGKRVCTADLDQIPAMEAAGWKTEATVRRERAEKAAATVAKPATTTTKPVAKPVGGQK